MSRKKTIENQDGASHNMATAQYPRGFQGEELRPWGKRGNSISAQGTIVYNKETAPAVAGKKRRKVSA